ncbi:MAG: Uma2 family endonuclease [Pseudonocardia sp.]|nr:Uma2 family endonuclease [Pseudonocardia sp.]
MTVMTTRISADEFLAGDYPTGSELIDGVVHVIDATFRHQRLCSRCYNSLYEWTRTEPGHGEIGWGGNWVLSDSHVYKPDVWWAATPPDGTRHDGPPDLAVEVRSPGTWRLDIGPKRAQYLASGTKELWLIDTPARTVLVYRAGAFDDPLEIGPGEDLTSPLLPGFALPIDALFAD